MNECHSATAMPRLPLSSDDTHVHDAGSARSASMLFVDQSGQLGGAELSLLPLAREHAARSEVLLLADGPFRTRLEMNGVRVSVADDARLAAIRRDALHVSWLRALPGVFGQMRRVAARARQFDILFLNTQKALVLGTLGKPLHGRPIVWHVRDIMTREHFGPVQLQIVRWLVRLAVDQLIANSRASADALIALTGLPADAVPVVYNGIDTDAFSTLDDTDMRALRRRLGLPETAWLAGLFGRLARWKGQHVAIEALTRVPDIHLVLVGAALFGEDDYARELRDLAVRLGVAERVHFAGFRDDTPAWMKAMDVIIHASTEPEPFGRVIVEGMAAARPVIASASGGVLEIVQHAENGWLVEPGNPAALADALVRLHGDVALSLRLAVAGCARAREAFSLGGYLDQMNQIITRMASRGAPAGTAGP